MITEEHTREAKPSVTHKILLITSCTKDKALPLYLPPHSQLQANQLWDGKVDDRTLRDFGELEEYRMPAGRLYRGLQHTQLMEGVELLRQAFGPNSVELKIISAGFGLVSEHQLLPPYEATFADLPPSEILTLAQQLRIPQKIGECMNTSYDCAFFLLSKDYLLSLNLPFNVEPPFPCLFLTSRSSSRPIPKRHPYYLIPAGKDEGITFSYNLVGLKGRMFRLFAQQIVDPGPKTLPPGLQLCTSAKERLQRFFITPTPEFFLTTIHPLRRSNRALPQSDQEGVIQQPLFPFAKTQRGNGAKNYGRPMRYFIPDWDDLVDPGYDFEHDTPTPQKKKYYDEMYAHQIYKKASYDGLLFSKGTIEDGKVKTARVRELGIHKFAHFDKPIMGDCGAFSYSKSKNPPYQTQEILDYYQALGFDYGVSIDHLIVPKFYSEKEYRYHLTRENARTFLELHRAGSYTFTPIGVAQGWSPETYKNAVIELLEWGYQYIALGGLTRTSTETIYEILEAVAPVLQADTDLHLFGVARDKNGDEMELFRRLGVTSFDSASYLRRAWMSDKENYFTEDGERYTALRISPISLSHPRVKKTIAKSLVTFEQLQKLEQEALKAVREYDKGKLDIETALGILLEIDKVEGHDYDRHKVTYRKTLEDRPWKKCSCEICRHLGIEVIIFRGNDRNRRRGFHNTYVFYQRFRKSMDMRLL